jgi:hypothetical protein
VKSHSAALITALISLAACGESTNPSAALTTFFSYTGSPGDQVSPGDSQRYVLPDANWQALVQPHGNSQHVAIFVGPHSGSTTWSLDFAGPQGRPLAVGTYNGARRYPFEGPTEPGLSVVGTNGCNALTGRFTVLDAAYGAGDSVKRFRATFQVLCDGAPAALTGEISIVANPWR